MEIESFNQLFAEAKANGLMIDSLSEDVHGFFRARWSSRHVVGPEIKRRQPFTAALDAYLECKRIADEDAAGGEGDLFG